MPPRKAKTAFLYYQGDQLSNIRAELGLSMGDAMTELASRWRSLSPEEKQPYLEMEAKDKERFLKESRQADAEAAAQVEAKRAALTVQDGETHSSRGARQRIEQERQEKEEARKQRRQERLENMDEDELEERNRLKEEQRKETEERRREKRKQEKALAKQHNKIDKEEAKRASQRLEYLLKQSSIFAKLQGGKQGDKLPSAQTPKKGGISHHRDDHQEESNESEEEDEEAKHVFLTKQPSCIKFGQLKPYQMEGLNWMIHLSEKGLNGILADEMGLGKTLQSISILAYHWEYRRIQGPHLVCVPKSTLSNWMNELDRWCPSLRAIKFHGSREEREYMVDNFFTNEAAAHDGKRPDSQIMGPDGELIDDNSDNPRQWDVCVTTYEIANAEKKTLQKFAWKYLVIDEAHRLKNDASMFSTTVRSFRTMNRLLLTGTPLQNNLHELWALLNFLLPDIFGSAEVFDEWFNLEIDDEDAKKNMISQLHKILRPFMLRRLKVDVAKGLPPKTETILMVGMSKMQKQLYKKLLLRDLDSITGNTNNKNRTAVLNIVMQLRKCCGHPYLFEGVEDRTLDPLGEHLVENCGKLSMVDKLLKRLKERGNRILIFTQMTRVLDILEDFMVMRGYEYCRIDGNTDYDNRESAIDEFNREGSTKFCFLLSTRAGGLGINLQTADTCILYDSDWNPQQDLQAQDRCHRLGQKKPVNVFRLVSENTVEEKIVERAQQKLKLDAMVVQSGRLKEKDKVSKDEIMAAVRFGADTVFRSEESTITDEDIDTILERGAQKTKELNDKLKEREKGDLLDFRLDGGISAQTFEGVDYSDKELRDHLRMLAADSMGRRERRPVQSTYTEASEEMKAAAVVSATARIKLPKALRVPQMEDHQFFRRERLQHLAELELENYAALRESGNLPPREVMEQEKSLLPPELAQEKRELMAEGFSDWTRTMYFHFVKACAKYGRDDIQSIANDMDMPEDAVRPYSEAFWKYGPEDLKNEWERVSGTIEKGEKKLAKQKKLAALLSKFVNTFDNPREEMTFANKGTTHFALEQDRALLCAVENKGYGNWDAVREEIATDDRLKFQHLVQGMTTAAITKRADYRMRQVEKELDAREKNLKNQRPAAILAAQKVLDCAKEIDWWEMQTRAALLDGEEPPSIRRLSVNAKQEYEERLQEHESAIARLREIEVQVGICLDVAEETRQAIYRGDQYVNYSNITLKAGGPASTKDEKVQQQIQDSVEAERLINPQVLKIPVCKQCENCLHHPVKLCVKRLEARKRFMQIELKKIAEAPRPKKTKKRKSEGSKPPKTPTKPNKPTKKRKLMMKKADGQLKIRVTSQGNKRMAIPEELFPDFCRRISASGTSERAKVIAKFVEDNPTISNRQVTLRMADITTRDKPDCIAEPPAKKSGRSFIFYLRPMYYKYLPEDERPPEWEKYAAEDEKLYEEEQKNKDDQKNTNDEEMSSAKKSDVLSVANSDAANDDGDETEEEVDEPAPKKAKVAE